MYENPGGAMAPLPSAADAHAYGLGTLRHGQKLVLRPLPLSPHVNKIYRV